MTENTNENTAQPAADANQIAHYYDANTRKFLRFGGAGETGAIHRAIWAPGVTERTEAFQFLNRLVANAVKPLIETNPRDTHLVDLGCGVGGTATFLARELDIRVTGISISETQVALAKERSRNVAQHHHIQFVTADFEDIPELGQVDAMCAIESFVHTRDPKAFFLQAAATLKRNGRLVICDDFLGENVTEPGLRCVQRFKKGWQLNSLLTVKEMKDIAKQNGFRLIESHPLSMYLRGFPTATRCLLSTLCRIPLPWAYWHNLSGGTALQLCVKRGWTEYQAIVWEKIE